MREKELKVGMAENPVLTLNPRLAPISPQWGEEPRGQMRDTVDWRTEDGEAC